jgi:hypothetical protein
VRSFFREVTEFAADVEKPLGKPSKFATGVVIFQLKAKHLQKVTGGRDGIADGGWVGAKRGCSLREASRSYAGGRLDTDILSYVNGPCRPREELSRAPDPGADSGRGRPATPEVDSLLAP